MSPLNIHLLTSSLAFLLATFSLLPTLPAQVDNTIFTRLTKENGLPNDVIHTALMDSRGFLWFGTQDGWSAGMASAPGFSGR